MWNEKGMRGQPERDGRRIIGHDNGGRSFAMTDPLDGYGFQRFTGVTQQGPRVERKDEKSETPKAPRRSLLEVLGSSRSPIVNALFRRSSR